MKKTDAKAFADFMLDEATKYVRQLTPAEIDTWFETFKRCSLEDFKEAWIQHKRDEKHGRFFPTIPVLQRLLRVTGEENAKRDWRCAAEVNAQRCNYPGAISEGLHGGGPWHCAGHFNLFRGELTKGAVQERSLSIIERSQSYVPPKTYDELYRLNDARRAGAKRQEEIERKRRPSDALRPVASIARGLDPEGYAVADDHIARADGERMAEVNRALAEASAHEALHGERYGD